MTTAHRLILTAAFFVPAIVFLSAWAAYWWRRGVTGIVDAGDKSFTLFVCCVLSVFAGVPASAWVDWIFFTEVVQ